ncbi:hypothetical protein [Virgibacillus salinus]|uniref:hypothetical protein n=1 Tax=Virgibacillus salinus TaxID=553311 RepID=UPI0015880EE7|nr:hypothetical protein [Virgibacillus salinus]
MDEDLHIANLAGSSFRYSLQFHRLEHDLGSSFSYLRYLTSNIIDFVHLAE